MYNSEMPVISFGSADADVEYNGSRNYFKGCKPFLLFQGWVLILVWMI